MDHNYIIRQRHHMLHS